MSLSGDDISHPAVCDGSFVFKYIRCKITLTHTILHRSHAELRHMSQDRRETLVHPLRTLSWGYCAAAEVDAVSICTISMQATGSLHLESTGSNVRQQGWYKCCMTSCGTGRFHTVCIISRPQRLDHKHQEIYECVGAASCVCIWDASVSYAHIWVSDSHNDQTNSHQWNPRAVEAKINHVPSSWEAPFVSSRKPNICWPFCFFFILSHPFWWNEVDFNM